MVSQSDGKPLAEAVSLSQNDGKPFGVEPRLLSQIDGKPFDLEPALLSQSNGKPPATSLLNNYLPIIAPELRPASERLPLSASDRKTAETDLRLLSQGDGKPLDFAPFPLSQSDGKPQVSSQATALDLALTRSWRISCTFVDRRAMALFSMRSRAPYHRAKESRWTLSRPCRRVIGSHNRSRRSRRTLSTNQRTHLLPVSLPPSMPRRGFVSLHHMSHIPTLALSQSTRSVTARGRFYPLCTNTLRTQAPLWTTMTMIRMSCSSSRR